MLDNDTGVIGKLSTRSIKAHRSCFVIPEDQASSVTSKNLKYLTLQVLKSVPNFFHEKLEVHAMHADSNYTYHTFLKHQSVQKCCRLHKLITEVINSNFKEIAFSCFFALF